MGRKNCCFSLLSDIYMLSINVILRVLVVQVTVCLSQKGNRERTNNNWIFIKYWIGYFERDERNVH